MILNLTTSIDDSEAGSPWVLTPLFAYVLDAIPLKFRVQNSSPEFHGGAHEGKYVTTAPRARRRGRNAGHGEVLVYTSFLPSSLTSIPIKYLYPCHPGPGDVAVVIRGENVGCTLDLDGDFRNGNILLGITRDEPRRWVEISALNLVISPRR